MLPRVRMGAADVDSRSRTRQAPMLASFVLRMACITCELSGINQVPMVPKSGQSWEPQMLAFHFLGPKCGSVVRERR
jgi:hypothetical protein